MELELFKKRTVFSLCYYDSNGESTEYTFSVHKGSNREIVWGWINTNSHDDSNSFQIGDVHVAKIPTPIFMSTEKCPQGVLSFNICFERKRYTLDVYYDSHDNDISPYDAPELEHKIATLFATALQVVERKIVQGHTKDCEPIDSYFGNIKIEIEIDDK